MDLNEELIKTMECVGLLSKLMESGNGDNLDLLQAQNILLNRYNNKLKEWNKDKEYERIMDYKFGSDPIGDQL